MTIELRPLGVACNLACSYCYQQPQRDAGNHRTPYDLEKIKAEAERIGGPFTLFGGEPLLMKFDDLEHLFAWGLERFGANTIQTNGVLIEGRHIDLFRRYKVSVGISIDGPGPMNDARWNGSLEKTRQATARVEGVIAQLCEARQIPSLIVTLHGGNASGEKIPEMIEWMHRLDTMGIRNVRLHLLEVDDESLRGRLVLSARQNISALLAFAQAEPRFTNIRFDLFRDIENLLEGKDGKASCIWRACDPYTTEAVQGVEGNGQSSNCGRTNKDGIDFIKAQVPGFERYVALFNAPQSDHGCAGCRFFLMCKGQCPGTAVGGDWRNRTENCEEWKHLFQLIESRLVLAGRIPLTLQPLRLELERFQITAWKQGRNPSISKTLGYFHQGLLPAGPAAEPEPQPSEIKNGSGSIPRISWVSNAARSFWQPRMEQVRTMLEDFTVHAGRLHSGRCSVRRVPESSLERLAGLAGRMGVGHAFLPASALTHAVPSDPWAERSGLLVCGEPSSVASVQAAWADGDRGAFLARLEVPPCCLAGHSASAEALSTVHLDDGFSPHSLLAPLGLSLLPVAPCQPGCRHALDAARTLRQAALDGGYGTEVDWLQEMMSWSISWTDRHGITEVKAPVFKLCFLAPPGTADTAILKQGVSHVAFATQGLGFPFSVPARKTITLHADGRRAAACVNSG